MFENLFWASPTRVRLALLEPTGPAGTEIRATSDPTLRRHAKSIPNRLCCAMNNVFSLLTFVTCLGTVATFETASGQQTEHPFLLVAAKPKTGLRCVDDIRKNIKTGRTAQLWQDLFDKVEKEAKEPPIVMAAEQNRSYPIVARTCNRITDAALVALITDQRLYAEAALSQIEVLFEQDKWPEWADQAHLDAGLKSDLRHGQFARAIGFAYDWLYPLLTHDERQRIVDGLDRCAIKPFQASVKAKEKWVFRQSNWKTSVVGGFAILGMALGEDHPEAKWLREFANPLLDDYMKIFGSKGEFNENPAYASSVRHVVDHYLAKYYASGGQEKPTQLEQLGNFSRWMLYCISPPKRMIAFGDAHTNVEPNIAYFGAIASVLRDPVVQWTYLQFVEFSRADSRPRALELLYFDPTVQPQSPSGRLPLADSFPAQSGIITSRSSWDPPIPVSAVWAKARTEDVHRHADWGQVCIDGFGEPLIVDLGSPPVYPKTDKHRYYNYQQSGHNVLVLGDDEYDVDWRVRRQGKTVWSSFKEGVGSAWSFDLSEVYAKDRRVLRHVVHLFPRIVVVLDEANLPQTEQIRLRWHTRGAAKPDPEGRFACGHLGVHLAGCVSSLGDTINLTAGRHEYRPPYDKGRLGKPYPQRYEPFIETQTRSDRFRVLSLFCITGPGEEIEMWTRNPDGWQIRTAEGIVRVRMHQNNLIVQRSASHALSIPLHGPTESSLESNATQP